MPLGFNIDPVTALHHPRYLDNHQVLFLVNMVPLLLPYKVIRKGIITDPSKVRQYLPIGKSLGHSLPQATVVKYYVEVFIHKNIL
jgi:hypothetical protein